jgi:hypothetical protein
MYICDNWYVLYILVDCRRAIIQGDQKVSVHLMITIQKITSNVQSVPPPVSRHLLTRRTDRQCQGDTRLTLAPSVIPNSKYFIMVSD